MSRRTQPKGRKSVVTSTEAAPTKGTGGNFVRRSGWDVALCLSLACVTVAAYANVLENGFVNVDDDYYVYRNDWAKMGLSLPALQWAFTTFDFGNWHPLTWLSLQLDNQLFGLSPKAYHATNLAIHVANTLALYGWLRALTGAVGRSAAVSAFFALHPLHVESVAWIAERKDVLCALFFLLTLILWDRYVRRPSIVRYAVALVSFVLCLLSKAMGVSLPLLLLLLDVWPLGRWTGVWGAKAGGGRTATQLVVEKAPFALLSAAIAGITILAQQSAGAMNFAKTLSLGDRLLMVPVNYVSYLYFTLWPAKLAVLYPHSGAAPPQWQWVGASLLLALLTAACLMLRKSRPYLLVGWLWFCVMLLPVIGILQVGYQSVADRYMYLPMIGLLIAGVWGVYDLCRGNRRVTGIAALACAAAIAACLCLTSRQVSVWRDSMTLWRHALAITPPAALSCNNYALALEQSGDLEGAENWYRRSIEIEPSNYYANCNLGTLLSKTGQQQEAAEHLDVALESQPNNPLLLENMGVVQELLGHEETALEYYQASARLDPRSPRIHQHLERVLRRLRDTTGPTPPSGN